MYGVVKVFSLCVQLISISGTQLDDLIEIPIEWHRQKCKQQNWKFNVHITLNVLSYCLDEKYNWFLGNGAAHTNGMLITSIRTIRSRYRSQNRQQSIATGSGKRELFEFE